MRFGAIIQFLRGKRMIVSRILALFSIWITIPPGTQQLPLKKYAADTTSDMGAVDTEVIAPVFIDGNGTVIGSHGLRSMRIDRRHYVKITAFGKEFVLNMTRNRDFMASNILVEHRGNSTMETLGAFNADCYHKGLVSVGNVTAGKVALSSCRGLRGLIAIDGGVDYLVEPLQKEADGENWKYLLHRRSANLRAKSTVCGFDRGKSLSEPQLKHRPVERAAVYERYVEVALVVDRSMQDFYGADLKNYVFTLMNMVGLLFKDPTINTALNIVLVKLVLTGQNGVGFVSGSAQQSIESFCVWQNSLRVTPPNHDIAILLTRQQICTEWDTSCSVVGVAPEGDGCVATRSCNINKDIGPATAYTIAHEIGHNLGMLHDDDPNQPCPSGLYIMTSSLAASNNLNRWSVCSQQQLLQFFDSNTCLDNRPQVTLIPDPLDLPGTLYSANSQCQWLYDVPARHCEGPKELEECAALYCNISGICQASFVPPVSGTNCTYNGTAGAGRCFDGVCVQAVSLETPVNGGWGVWGDWGECSTTCGIGVQYRERPCNSPVPNYGGNFCSGSNRQYQTCSNVPCPGRLTYRDEQCKLRNTGFQAFYPTYTSVSPCSLYCTDSRQQRYLLPSKLKDGTSCYLPPNSPGDAQQLGVCISSDCIPVGCDYLLNTTTTKDACGVVCGNGSLCSKVSEVIASNSSEVRIIIPKGATTITVGVPGLPSMDTLTLNTSAVFVSVNATTPLLPAVFVAAGTMWTLDRAAELQVTFRATGPTQENVYFIYVPSKSVQLNVTGVGYAYFVPRTAM